MKKSILTKKILLISLFLLLFSCASNLATKRPAAIEVKHENICLQPIKGLEKLESSEYWPDSIWQGKLLIENMQQMWKNLLGEFRRCEKYGLYTMVDSTASSTVDITPEVIYSRIKKDTLFVSIGIKTYHKESKRSSTMSVDAYGLFKNDVKEAVTIQDLVSVFTDFRRRFPYGKVVSAYYSGSSEK